VTTDPQDHSSEFVQRVEAVLLDRLDRIERENRRLKRYGSLMLVGVAVVLGMTVAVFWYSGKFGLGGAVTENLAARRFTIRDSHGATRGTWGIAEDGTVRFQLSDLQGRPRVRLSLLPDGSSGLSFADTTDRKLLVLGALPDQSTSFVMSDRTGVPRAVLGMSGNGSSNLVFADGNGATKAGLGVDARGQGSLTLADKGLQQQATEPEPGDSEVADSQPQPAQQPVKPARKK
jgi:hypothetical protein